MKVKKIFAALVASTIMASCFICDSVADDSTFEVTVKYMDLDESKGDKIEYSAKASDGEEVLFENDDFNPNADTKHETALLPGGSSVKLNVTPGGDRKAMIMTIDWQGIEADENWNEDLYINRIPELMREEVNTMANDPAVPELTEISDSVWIETVTNFIGEWSAYISTRYIYGNNISAERINGKKEIFVLFFDDSLDNPPAISVSDDEIEYPLYMDSFGFDADMGDELKITVDQEVQDLTNETNFMDGMHYYEDFFQNGKKVKVNVEPGNGRYIVLYVVDWGKLERDKNWQGDEVYFDEQEKFLLSKLSHPENTAEMDSWSNELWQQYWDEYNMDFYTKWSDYVEVSTYTEELDYEFPLESGTEIMLWFRDNSITYDFDSGVISTNQTAGEASNAGSNPETGVPDVTGILVSVAALCSVTMIFSRKKK